jgi:hypothetical protein
MDEQIHDRISAKTGSDRSMKAAMAATASMENKRAVEAHKKKVKERAQQDNQNLWQHPFVDVFKHFKVLPCDWKANKKTGDVQELFVSFNHPGQGNWTQSSGH